MEQQEPIVLSLGGWDPCGGAGLAADIKTFEAHRLLGLGVTTALTAQNHQHFIALHPISTEHILDQLTALLKVYQPQAAKFGLIPDTGLMEPVIDALQDSCPGIELTWDPVLKASAGFQFHSSFKKKELFALMRKMNLLTPNQPEAQTLFGTLDPQAIQELIHKEDLCPVLLKGGHAQNHANDLLIQAHQIDTISGKPFPSSFAKHGSGCVLSAAICCGLAKGSDLLNACSMAKSYTENFLQSAPGPLGWHVLSNPKLKTQNQVSS